MKKSIFITAATLLAVACGGANNNTPTESEPATTNDNKYHAERIDEITANAKENFNRGADKGGEFAKEVDKSISDGAKEVSQRAKASMERGGELYDKVKVEVKNAADNVKDKSVELGTELVVKSAEAYDKAVEAGSKTIQRVKDNLEE